jgi:AP-3 complex subunit delta-1
VQLFAFIRADLASFRPEDDSITDPPVSETSQNPTYPKSLLLINPLFSAYELNSVNTAAQDCIPLPESLDLDAWIIPPPRQYTMPDAVPADYTPEGERPSVKKKLKGKGKHKGKEKMSQAATHSSRTEPIPSPGLSETEEDKAEREKASWIRS